MSVKSDKNIIKGPKKKKKRTCLKRYFFDFYTSLIRIFILKKSEDKYPNGSRKVFIAKKAIVDATRTGA